MEDDLVPLGPGEELTSPDELDLLDGIEPGNSSAEKEEEESP